MMKKFSLLIVVLLATLVVGVILFGATNANAQNATVPATYVWDQPTVGNPVAYYIAELSSDGGPFVLLPGTIPYTGPTDSLFVDLEVLQIHQVRVAGVDASGNAGVFSEPSDPYVPDLGAPGSPGTPQRVVTQ